MYQHQRNLETTVIRLEITGDHFPLVQKFYIIFLFLKLYIHSVSTQCTFMFKNT